MTAFAARTRPGPPENGRYAAGDTVPDSGGIVWNCVKGGFSDASAFAADRALWTAVPFALPVTTFGIGAVNGATVSAVETGIGSYHKTVLTLAATPQAVVNGTEYQGVKIYDFPASRVLILGVIASLAPTTTSAIASTINSGVTGAVSLGSVVASNVTLSSTMVDLAPSTAFASSTTINVAAAAVTPTLAASAQFASALDMYLNSAFATTTDVDADGTMTWAGSVQITWVALG